MELVSYQQGLPRLFTFSTVTNTHAIKKNSWGMVFHHRDNLYQGPATLYMSSDAMKKRGKYNNDIHRPKSPGGNLGSEISPLVSFLVNGK